MVKANWILLAIAAALAALILFAPQVAWQLRAVLVPPAPDTDSDLAPENAALKAELAKLQNIRDQLPDKPWNYTRAVVLSRYPLNFKNEFLVDVGSAQGIEEGKAVIYGKMLIGKVSKVFENSSLVKTVFDSGFQTAARIGYSAAEALFKGGLTPRLTLVASNVKMNKGDIVYSASPDFPYGLPLASIKETAISDDKLFQEATLEFAYDINGVRTVFISNLKP